MFLIASNNWGFYIQESLIASNNKGFYVQASLIVSNNCGFYIQESLIASNNRTFYIQGSLIVRENRSLEDKKKITAQGFGSDEEGGDDAVGDEKGFLGEANGVGWVV